MRKEAENPPRGCSWEETGIREWRSAKWNLPLGLFFSKCLFPLWQWGKCTTRHSHLRANAQYKPKAFTTKARQWIAPAKSCGGVYTSAVLGKQVHLLAWLPEGKAAEARKRRKQGRGTHLVVVVKQAKGSRTVFIPVDAHHGLGGRCQGVLQVWLPGLILTGVGSSGIEWRVTRHGHQGHQSFITVQQRERRSSEKQCFKSAHLYFSRMPEKQEKTKIKVMAPLHF